MSNSIKIGDNLIGNKNDVYLIAEIELIIMVILKSQNS